MKFKINTGQLNAILSIVSKGVGNNKILPITEYLLVKLQDKVLTITSTDTNNFVTYKQHGIEGEEGEVIVKANTLIKLIEKTTKQEVTFKTTEESVEVVGNGKYKVPLLNEEYPNYEFDYSTEKAEVNTKELLNVFKTNDSAIASEMIMPCLTGFNIGDNCITTDGIKMCINDKNMLPNNRILVTQVLANLLSNLNEETVTIQKQENKILFTTEKVTIFGTELNGLKEYPDVTPILDVPYENNVEVSKKELQDTLERLSLFVDPFDNNGVLLTFKETRLEVQDLKKNSLEVLEYSNQQNSEEVTLLLNIKFLKDLVGALSKDTVNIYFDDGKPIKLVEGDVTQILSTMSREEE